MPDTAAIDQTRAACRSALEHAADLAPIWRAWRDGRADLVAARAMLPRVQTGGESVTHLARVKEALARDGFSVDGGAFERFLILAAAADAVDRLADLPVDERVRALFCQNFQLYASADSRIESFEMGRGAFVAMARMATLLRFPAGQLDWEVSGLPRSWIFQASARRLPRLLSSIACELGGFGPVFFSHINPNRRNQGILLERESLRSYHRMARAMAKQPAIKGFITASWLHSPDTFAVSPHLAWLNTVFLEHGGHVIPLGAAPIDSGVLHRSPERQQAYDSGKFIPTQALVIWPRAAMLAWAAGHEELRDDRVRSAALAMQEARV